MHGLSGGRPHKPRSSGRQPFWMLLGEILLREATIGTVLYATMGSDHAVNGLICLGGLVLTMAMTRRFGLLRHRGWQDVITESLIVFCGALAFRNIVIVLVRQLYA